MSAPVSPFPDAAAWPRVKLTQEVILAALFAVEVAAFSVFGTNFLSRDNAFEVVRAHQIEELVPPARD